MKEVKSISKKHDIVLILDNLRSVQNVASIFRVADCAGVLKIYLVGTSPTPIDKFNRLRKDFIKISLGSESTVSYEYFKTIDGPIKKLKKDGFIIYALEQDKNSIHYKKEKYPKKLALVSGNEPYGIDKKTLKKCDKIVEIPQFGQKESLNVLVATSVVLFEIVS